MRYRLLLSFGSLLAAIHFTGKPQQKETAHWGCKQKAETSWFPLFMFQRLCLSKNLLLEKGIHCIWRYRI